jgi:drug/metabolite transporter (DMT)-like permease
MPYVWFALICCIWGSSFILMKRAAVCLSPAAISTGRVVFGAAVLAAVLWSLRKPLAIRRRDALPLVGVVLTGFAWPYTIQPWLIGKHQNSAFIGMTVAFTPLLTLGISIFVLHVRPTARQVIGVLGALVCLSLLMWDGWKQRLGASDLALAFSVPLTYAIANNWIRKSLTHIPAVELTFWCLTVSGAILLPGALLSPTPVTYTPDGLWTAWGGLLVLGILGTGVATCLFNRLILEQGPLFAAMVTNLVPLGAMLWGWFDAEVITPRQLVAFAGVLSMVIFVQYGAAVRPMVVPPPRLATALCEAETP